MDITKASLKYRISRLWRLREGDDRLIGKYTFDSEKGKYFISDIRKPNFKRIGYYPIYEDKAEKPPVVIELSAPLENIQVDNFFQFEFKIVDNYKDDPHEITIDLSKPYGDVEPQWLIDTLFKDRHDDLSGDFETTKGSLDTLESQLSSHDDTFIYELLQNANDYPVDGEKVEVQFRITDDYLLFMHTGRVFDERNISGICGINEKEKADNRKTIGYKGIGFKTVFHDSNYVYIETGNYHFRFDEKAEEIEVQNAPWAIMPIWTEKADVDRQITDVFDNADPKFRVKIALRPKDKSILTRANHGYKEVLKRLFSAPKVILFVPEVKSVEYFDHDRSELKCDKTQGGWIVSKTYDTPVNEIGDDFQELVNHYITEHGERGRIPKKYKDLESVQTQFACEFDDETKQIRNIKGANLYCYLPAKDAIWGFEFLMNSDMIPNADRNDIQKGIPLTDDIDFNVTLAYVAGKCFFKWIQSLLERAYNGQYEADSVFGLIPDFDSCEDKYPANKDFIEAFRKGFEECILSDENKFIKTIDGIKSFEEVLFDETRITTDGVIDDSDFCPILHRVYSDCAYLADMLIRKGQNFQNFLRRYSSDYQTLTWTNLERDLCERTIFLNWLLDSDNNAAFLKHIFKQGKLSEFGILSIFRASNGTLHSADDLYYEIGDYLGDILPFDCDGHLDRLDINVKKALESDPFWSKEKGNSFFREFKASDFLNEIISEDYIDSTEEKLREPQNSYSFVHFLTTAKLFVDKLLDLPMVDNAGTVNNNWHKTVFLPCNDIKSLASKAWVDSSSFVILNESYLKADKDEVCEYLINNFNVINYSDKEFIPKVILSDYCVDTSSKNIDDSIDFVKYVEAHKEYIGDGTLSSYKLFGTNVDGESNSHNTNVVYEDTPELKTLINEPWFPNDVIFILDSSYVRNRITLQFLKDKFAIKTVNDANGLAVLIKEYLPDIVSWISDDKSRIESFYRFLNAHADILTIVKASEHFGDIPYIDKNGSILTKDNSADVYYLYNSDLGDIVDDNDWIPTDKISIASDKLPSEVLKLMGFVPYNINHFVENVILLNKEAIVPNIINIKSNVSFHKLMSDNQKKIIPDNISKLIGFPVFVYDRQTDDGNAYKLAKTDSIIYFADSVTQTFIDGQFVDCSLLNVLCPLYEDNKAYWVDGLKFTRLDVNSLRGLLGNSGISESVKTQLKSDVEKNVEFWRWICKNYNDEGRLKMVSSYKDFPMLVETHDGEVQYALASSLYLNTEYGFAGKSIVKRLKPTAKFVSSEYISDSESSKALGLLFKSVGLIKSTSELVIDLIDKCEFNGVKDTELPKMIAEAGDDLRDYYDKMTDLQLLTKSGFLPISQVCINDNIGVVPFSYITLGNEVELSAYADGTTKRFIKYLADKAGSTFLSNEHEWKRKKIEFYVDHQDSFGKEVNIKLVTDLANEYKANKELVDEKETQIRFYSSDGSDSTFAISDLTLSSAYATNTMLKSIGMCDYQGHGIKILRYLSDEYTKDSDADTIASYVKSIGIHYGFEKENVALLANREFAIYFWTEYIRSNNVREHINSLLRDGAFKGKACVPTEKDVKKAEDLYSLSLERYVRDIAENWGEKIPYKDIPLSDAFTKLDFKETLDCVDCLNAMLQPSLMNNEEESRNLLNQLVSSYTHEDAKYIQEYRNVGKVLNGKKEMVPIKELYAVMPYMTSKSYQLYHDNKLVMLSYAMPEFQSEAYGKACQILGIEIINDEDIEFNPSIERDETESVINTLRKQLLIAAAVENPSDWKQCYEKFLERARQYSFKKCRSIRLQYKKNAAINANTKKYWQDESNRTIYFTKALSSGPIFGAYRESLYQMLGMAINKDMLDDILCLSTPDDFVDYVNEHCYSLLDDKYFLQLLESTVPGASISVKERTFEIEPTNVARKILSTEDNDVDNKEFTTTESVENKEPELAEENSEDYHIDTKEEVAKSIDDEWKKQAQKELPRRSGGAASPNVTNIGTESGSDNHSEANSNAPIYHQHANEKSNGWQGALNNGNREQRAISNAARLSSNTRNALDAANDTQKTIEMLSHIDKYSYKWYKYLLHLQGNADSSSEGENFDVDFMDVSFDDGHVILSKPVPFIPFGIDDSPLLSMTFIMKNGVRYKKAYEVIGVANKELILNMPIDDFSSEQWDEFKQCHVSVKKVNGNLSALANGFAKLRTEDGHEIPDVYRMDEHLPKNIDFIYGPPGTGKTREVVKEITQRVKDHIEDSINILVLTPTNKAADVVAKRLMKDEEIRPYLKRFGTTSDEELISAFDILANRNTLDLADKSINVVVTNTTRYCYDSLYVDGNDSLIRKVKWDAVYIDEASMIDIVTMTYVLYQSRGADFVISGDPYQILPVCHQYIQHENIYTMVGLSSFGDVIDGRYQRYNVLPLKTQYRSIPSIGKLVSDYTYDGKVDADRTEQSQKELALDGMDVKSINIIGFKTADFDSLYGISTLNDSSVQVYSIIFTCRFAAYIAKQVAVKYPGKTYTIGIISPYKAEADSIANMVESMPNVNEHCKITCGTVHSFQGDECDIIIFVMNPPAYIGSGSHINNQNIINVAMSRASDYLFILSPMVESKNLIGRDTICTIAEKLDCSISNASDVEAAMSDGNRNFIEENTVITGHNPVNVYSDEEELRLYEVRISDTAIDIKINKE